MGFVRRTIAVGVFDDDDPIAFSSFGDIVVGNLLAIVHHFANPNATKMINVDVRRVGEEGFRCQ